MTNLLFVITISHQLGSGGAILGQKMAERLDVPFFDREILRRVAQDLQMAESALENREERLSSFWEKIIRSAMLADPATMLIADHIEPSDQELFDSECKTLGKIAKKSSGVFLGRCGFYTLSDYPRQVHILVHADLAERVERVRALFHLDEKAALKMIQTNDRTRAAYIHAFTHQNWLDASLYDLTMNTSSLGMDKTLEFALDCVEQKLAVLATQSA
jgi:cytidylate kinase